MDPESERRQPLIVPLDLIQEVKVPVHKVTPKRISLYISDPSKPQGYKVVAMGHGSVKKYASQATSPPAGSKHKPIGTIETDTYKGMHDVAPIAAPTAGPLKKAVPSGQPDPDKFVPIYNWDAKHVWVFIKKPGQPVPVGPVAVPHKKVKKYVGKLGWFTQAMKLVGKIDPGVYSGPDDIYPLDWEPEDGPPEFVPTAAQAMHVAFQPGAASAADVTTTVTLKSQEPAEPQAPASIPASPGEFQVVGKDPNGYPKLKHQGNGMFYSLLPGGKIAQWSAQEQVYYPVIKDESGWDFDHDSPLVSLADLKKPQQKPPEGFVLPPGHTVKDIAKSHVVVTTPSGATVKWIKMTDHWVYADEQWKEYDPSSEAVPVPPPAKAEIPPGAPSVPKGFELGSGPNADGAWPLSTHTYQDDGNWFVLPNGKLVQYSAYSGTYQPWSYGKASWEQDKGPGMPPAAIALVKYYEPEGLKIPSGYEFAGYDSRGLPTVWKGQGMTLYALLPNGQRARWSDSKKKYKTELGVYLTLDQIKAGDFGTSDTGVQKAVVSSTPEDAPSGLVYVGSEDANGLPLVDEVFEDEEEEDQAEKGLTMLPDDRVARWRPVQKYYQIYVLDPHSGYEPSKKYETVSAFEAERLMQYLNLVVQNGKYHKVTHSGDDSPEVPAGFEALTPTQAEEGLVPLKHLESGKAYYLLPGNLVAGSAGAATTFDVWAITDKGLKTTSYKGLSGAQVRLMTQGYDPHPPEHTKLLPKKDVNGYPMVKTDEGDTLTLLPNGEIASWDKGKKKYEVWVWEYWSEDFTPAHPPKRYTLKQLLKLKPKTLPGVAGTPVKPVKASVPKVAPPTMDEPEVPVWKIKETAQKDDNGLPWVYLYKDDKISDSYVKLPTGDYGKWSDANGAYVVYELDPDPGEGVIPIYSTAKLWELEVPKKAPKPAPLEPKAVAKATSAKTSGELIKDLAGKLPDPKTLTLLGDGAQLGLGGAGKKSVYQDPTTGLKFIFKPALPKSGTTIEPFRAHAQEVFAAIAMKVRPDHIPIKTVKIKGKLGTLQPMIDLDPKGTLRGAALAPEKLTEKQKADVAVDHMLDWLMSQHDSHDGNMALTADGGVVSVDKEQGFRYFGSDKLDIDYHPNGQYGEKEPFYNTFWRSFSKGKLDFDPAPLGVALHKIESLDSAEYMKLLRPYAEAAFPGNAVKQQRFLNKALHRKLHLRRDFENFLTGLYRDRTGEEGTFNFEDGWLTEKEKKTKKYKTVTLSGPKLASDQYGIAPPKVFEFTDPETGQKTTDLERISLKLSKNTSQTQLLKFLEELGLEALPFPNGEKVITGQAYHIVSVNKAAYEASSVTKEVLITKAAQTTPETPKYWPEAADHIPVEEPNTEDWGKLHQKPLGREGHRVSTDGGAVEGQAGKAKKYRDSTGDYYFVSFKLRENAWSKIAKSSKVKSSSFTYREAEYDAEEQVFKETTHSIWTISKGVSWEYQGTECFVGTGTQQYAFMGAVYMKVRGVSGEQVHATIRKAINSVVDGLGTEVFKPPTKADREVMKLSRLLWAVAPQAADKLPESKRTVAGLKKALAAAGTDPETFVEEQEVFPGTTSHVLPGRWRKMAGGKVMFVWNGIGSLEAAVSILKSGLMSIHERNLTGIPQFGASFSADIRTGSADSSICRVATQSGSSSSFSGTGSGMFQAILHPSVLDRLDCYMHLSDMFGVCSPHESSAWKQRKTVEEQVKSVQSYFKSSNEISFRKGVHKKQIVRIRATSESYRRNLITAAQEQGMSEINGVPVEDFVVVAGSLGDAYTKYVKPLVGG